MYFDNLTGVSLVIAITLFIVLVLMYLHKTNTDKKIHRLAKQFHLIHHNEKAKQLCRLLHEKYPELCAGIDYTLKENGDVVSVDEWKSHHPHPGR